MNTVEWKEVQRDQAPIGDLPYATHEGTVDIAGFTFRCFQLNTGERIFDADDVAQFFGGAFNPSHPHE